MLFLLLFAVEILTPSMCIIYFGEINRSYQRSKCIVLMRENKLFPDNFPPPDIMAEFAIVILIMIDSK